MLRIKELSTFMYSLLLELLLNYDYYKQLNN